MARNSMLWLVATAVAFLLGGYYWRSGGSQSPGGIRALLSTKYLNAAVLRQVAQYPKTRIRPVQDESGVFQGMGVSKKIAYQGRTVAEGSGLTEVYCSGITFQVFMDACAAVAGPKCLLRGLSGTNIWEFRRDWYGVDGNRRTLVDALVTRGLGEEIVNPLEAKPGDFVQFWRRSGIGHSVVFLGWQMDPDGKIGGIRYWSAQNGYLAENVEEFGGFLWQVDSAQIYIVRALAP